MTALLHHDALHTAGQTLVAGLTAGEHATDGELLTTPGVLRALHDGLTSAGDEAEGDRVRAVAQRIVSHFAPAIRLVSLLSSPALEADSPLLDPHLDAVQAVSRHQARLAH